MLAVDVSPVDTGTVELYGNTPKEFPAFTTIFENEVELKAIPAPGYQFDGWSGDITSSDNPLILEMDCSKVVRANFSPVKYTLTMETSGSGSTEPALVSPDHVPGSTVDIVATPDKGWQFDSWEGKVVDPASAATSVIIDSSKTVTAVFSRIVHTLTLEVEGGGTTAPAVGSHDYNQGSTVDITAIPDNGWQFDSWAGEVDDTGLTATTISIDSNKTVTAIFKKSWLTWWLTGGGIAVVLIAGALVYMAVRRRRARDTSTS